MAGVPERLAEALVNIATERDEVTCSYCGRKVDLSEADTTPRVLATMKVHAERFHEGGDA